MPDFEELLKPEKKEKKGPTITISGLAGSGKSSAARKISEELGLKRVTIGEIFRNIGKERGLDIEEMMKTAENEIHHEADKRSLELAMAGNCVIDARISSWVAGKHSDFKIFLKAPPAVRAERVSGRDEMSFEEAFARISERDKTDRQNYKNLYGIDLFDLSIYDLVLNNNNFSKEDTAKTLIFIIKTALEI